MNQKSILEAFESECRRLDTPPKKTLNFIDSGTLEINLENTRQSPLVLQDFEVALSIIRLVAPMEPLTLNLNIIGLKIKEKGLSALGSLLDQPLSLGKLSLINIGLEERGSLVAFLARNSLVKGSLLSNLDLSGNNLQSEFSQLVDLLEGPLGNLKHLQLNYCNLHDESIERYCEGAGSDRLVSLQLEGNQFGP